MTPRWREADSNHQSRSGERFFWGLPIGDGGTTGGATYRLRARYSNVCLDYPIAFPFAEGPTVRFHLPPAASRANCDRGPAAGGLGRMAAGPNSAPAGEARGVGIVSAPPFSCPGPRRCSVAVETEGEATAITSSDYAVNVGRRSFHGRAASIWAARRKIVASSPNGATICTPTGKPCALQCSGRLAAG